MIDFGQLVLEKILKNFQCIFTLSLLSPLGIVPLNNLESPSPKNDLCQVCLEFVQLFWRRFSNDPSPFLHFWDYLTFEDDLALYLNKLENLHPRIICTKFD
jgi:hypothetical protein